MFTRLGAERVAASLRKIVTAPPKTLFVWLVASNPFCRDGFRVPDVQAESLLLMALTLSPSTVNPLEMDPKRDSPFAAALMIMESMDCIPLSFATLQIPSATTQNEPRLSTTATGTQPLLTLGYIFASLLVAFAVYYMRQHYPLRYIHMTFAFPPLTGAEQHGSSTYGTPFDYAFSASAAIRALETTHLTYIPPTPPIRVSTVQPLLFHTFSDSTGTTTLRDELSRESAANPGERAVPSQLTVLSMTPPPAVRSTPRSTSISSAPRLNRTSVGGVAHDFGAASSHHRRTPQGERLSTPGPSFHLFSTDPVIESPTSNPAPMASAPYSNLIDMTSGAQQDHTTCLPFARHFRYFKSGGGVKLESKEQGTAWFQTDSSVPISTPPDHTHCPSVELGDVFCHRAAGRCQLWLWLASNGMPPRWIPVVFGYKREDGRRLVVTDSFKIPSWVSEATYNAKFKYRSDRF